MLNLVSENKQWTCDSQVAVSSPGWTPLRSGLGQAMCASVTKQCNLVPAKRVFSLAGKVTADRWLKVTAAYHRVYD